MVLDQHVPHPEPHDAALQALRARQLPVGAQVESKLTQQSAAKSSYSSLTLFFSIIPQFTLDQDPPWRGHETVREIPGLQGRVGETETLPPEVENLLVEAEADQGPELDVHPGPGLVVGVINEVDASVQQLLGAQHFPILFQHLKYFLIIILSLF